MLLIGIYTGTRPGAILALRWLASIDAGWFDLGAGVLYRTGSKVRQSKKRQPPAKIHGRLMPHLRRWCAADMALGITSVVHYKGERVRKLRRSWRVLPSSPEVPAKMARIFSAIRQRHG
jgi:hypothetical protein